MNDYQHIASEYLEAKAQAKAANDRLSRYRKPLEDAVAGETVPLSLSVDGKRLCITPVVVAGKVGNKAPRPPIFIENGLQDALCVNWPSLLRVVRDRCGVESFIEPWKLEQLLQSNWPQLAPLVAFKRMVRISVRPSGKQAAKPAVKDTMFSFGELF